MHKAGARGPNTHAHSRDPHIDLDTDMTASRVPLKTLTWLWQNGHSLAGTWVLGWLAERQEPHGNLNSAAAEGEAPKGRGLVCSMHGTAAGAGNLCSRLSWPGSGFTKVAHLKVRDHCKSTCAL